MEKALLPQPLSLNNQVEISNDKENPILNMRLTLTQSNFMYLYLSKINARKPETKHVTFSLDEYANIMELKGRISTTRILNVTKSLYALSFPEYDVDAERVKLIHAFDNFELYKEDDNWYVTISCHQQAEKRFFELSQYTEFEVWNVLSLTTPTHRKMYEILKQHERLKQRDLTLKELRKLLLLKEAELSDWRHFKRMVDTTAKALKDKTDIYFTWEVLSKRGRGGKVHSLRFHIFKNEDVLNRPRQIHMREVEEQYKQEHDVEAAIYQEVEQMQEDLKKFQNAIEADYEEVDEHDDVVKTLYQERIEFFIEACQGEFNVEQMRLIVDLLHERSPGILDSDLGCYHYLQKLYHYMELRDMNLRAKSEKIDNRFAYFITIIGEEI